MGRRRGDRKIKDIRKVEEATVREKKKVAKRGIVGMKKKLKKGGKNRRWQSAARDGSIRRCLCADDVDEGKNGERRRTPSGGRGNDSRKERGKFCCLVYAEF